MEEVDAPLPPKFGLIGFALGVVSLLVIMIQLSAFFEPAAPSPSAGQVIGEIAADIKQSAARALSGEPAPPPPETAPDYGRYVVMAAMVIAAIAVVLGGIGLYRGEPHRLSYMAVGFGLSAFVMQYVMWLAILICGVILLMSIIANLGQILDGWG